MPTTTPTPTPPPFEKGAWLSWKERDGSVYHDASKAYQFVGSKNDEHAHLLDLTFGTLNVGVMVPEDLIALPLTLQVDGNNVNVLREPQRIARLKETVAVRLTDNKELVAKIESARNALTKMFPSEIERGLGDFFVIVENPTVSQVIQRKRNQRGEEELARFKVDGNGNLVRYQGFDLYSKAPLEVRDGKFWKDGREFIPRGAVTNNFLYRSSLDTPEVNLAIFKRDIDHLKRMGGGFVILHANFGPEFIGNQKWKNLLLGACEYAAKMGFIVELTPRGLGLNKDPKQPSWEADYTKVSDRFDSEALKQAWNSLLSDSELTSRLAASIHVFNPTPEPAYDTNKLRWNVVKTVFADINRLIRDKIGNPNAICAYSPPRYGADIDEVINDPPTGTNDALEWHPYEGTMGRIGRDFVADLQRLLDKRICTFVGEMGWDNSLQYVLRQFQTFSEKRIGWTLYFLNSKATDDITLVRNEAETTFRGYLATVFFRAIQQ
jgi:hypothetical protein